MRGYPRCSKVQEHGLPRLAKQYSKRQEERLRLDVEVLKSPGAGGVCRENSGRSPEALLRAQRYA